MKKHVNERIIHNVAHQIVESLPLHNVKTWEQQKTMKELQGKLVLSKWSFSNRRATRTSGFESAPTESKDAMQAALMTNLVPQNFSWANITEFVDSFARSANTYIRFNDHVRIPPGLNATRKTKLEH